MTGFGDNRGMARISDSQRDREPQAVASEPFGEECLFGFTGAGELV